MKRHMLSKVLGLCMMVAVAFVASELAHRNVLAQKGPDDLVGGGEATAARSVAYVGHDGVIRLVPSIAVTGNRISFAFFATTDDNGKLRGEMQLIDHDLAQVIHSDVAQLSPHPTHNRPVGATSEGSSSARLFSAVGGVTVNGEPRPGWRFINSPTFDSGEDAHGVGDTVCFELVNPDGVVVQQWSALLSSGDVKIEK